jgi:pyridoxine 4-dehydrogenase
MSAAAIVLGLAVQTGYVSHSIITTGPRVRARMSTTSAATEAALKDRVQVGTLDLPAIGVGALNWPLDKSSDPNTAEALRASVAGGVDFVDTAEAYGFGKSEELVRNSLDALGLKGQVKVTTKFAPIPWRLSASSVVDACRASAKRLGVETIDLYQLHFPDVIQPLAPLGIVQRKDEIYWQGLAQALAAARTYHIRAQARPARGLPRALSQALEPVLNRRS